MCEFCKHYKKLKKFEKELYECNKSEIKFYVKLCTYTFRKPDKDIPKYIEDYDDKFETFYFKYCPECGKKLDRD